MVDANCQRQSLLDTAAFGAPNASTFFYVQRSSCFECGARHGMGREHPVPPHAIAGYASSYNALDAARAEQPAPKHTAQQTVVDWVSCRKVTPPQFRPRVSSVVERRVCELDVSTGRDRASDRSAPFGSSVPRLARQTQTRRRRKPLTQQPPSHTRQLSGDTLTHSSVQRRGAVATAPPIDTPTRPGVTYFTDFPSSVFVKLRPSGRGDASLLKTSS